MKAQGLANHSFTTVRTTQYYVTIGILPNVIKINNRKDYPEEYIEIIKNVKKIQENFLPLNLIKEKLEKKEIFTLEENNTSKSSLTIKNN